LSASLPWRKKVEKRGGKKRESHLTVPITNVATTHQGGGGEKKRGGERIRREKPGGIGLADREGRKGGGALGKEERGKKKRGQKKAKERGREGKRAAPGIYFYLSFLFGCDVRRGKKEKMLKGKKKGGEGE